MKNKDEYFEKLLADSYEYAKKLSSEYLLLEHVLMVFFNDNDLKNILFKNNIDINGVKKDIEKYLSEYPLISKTHNKELPKNNKNIDFFISYYYTCKLCNQQSIDDKKNLFLLNTISSFLFMDDTIAQEILFNHNINEKFLTKIYQEFSNNYLDECITEIINKELKNADIESNTTMIKNKYASNINTSLINLSSFYGRENELVLAQQILFKKNKANILVIGKPGIGKTRFVLELAKQILLKNNNIDILKLDISELTSNIMLKGELETRIKTLYNSFSKTKETILFIDNINYICSSNDSSLSGDIANALKPFLQNNKVKIIGTIDVDDLHKIEKDEKFINNFFKLNLSELSSADTLLILKSLKKEYEKYFNCTYDNDILKLIIKCSERFIADKFLPMKSIDIMDIVGAFAKYENANHIDANLVYKALSLLLNVPIENISQDETQTYLELETNLKKEIMGQDEAIKKIVDSIIISRSGLREKDKTASSLMFIGASGVGKTEVCKVLSKLLNLPLIRFDMSEYMEEHSVSKLIGAPPGYKGFDDGKVGNGLLINRIDETPHCILLLDEIEKANPKIHNLLLQVMDNGKLTSSSGKVVSFEHVYLIMTSNVGSNVAHKQRIGFNSADESLSEEEYDNAFLPEFRSRIDATVSFNNLSDDVLKNICQKFLNELKNMLLDKNIKFKYTSKVVEYIIEKTKHINNGARPLKHIITNEIKNVIAKKIIFDNISQIVLNVKDNNLDFGE